MTSPQLGVHDLEWDAARELARTTFGPVAACVLPLGDVAGSVLAERACSATHLPAMTTSAMDGWAVAGTGPWRVIGDLLAGQLWPGTVGHGEAVGIATGAPMPTGAAAVLRREDGDCRGEGHDRLLHSAVSSALEPGTHVRPIGQECARGDEVVAAGTVITPAVAGLLAAAGLDQVTVRRPHADLLVLGDELLTSGPSRDGKLRDALGPLLSAWLPARGIELGSRRRVADTAAALTAALRGCSGDVVVTTGSTARGPVDHLHDVLETVGAELIVDGVRVRPGHPMLLARLADGRPLVGLPGNPLAAVSGLLTLFDPLARSLRGLPQAPHVTTALEVDVPAGPHATRLLPVIAGRPATYAGPGMLRGLALADSVVVVPPGGLPAGTSAQSLTPA